MTLAEYKANPSAWSPTFIVNSAATLAQWQDKTPGNDYERVRVDASLSTAYGIDLDYAGTKQVVFGGDYTLTFNLNETNGRCFYRPTKPDDPEMWMSLPKIKATNAFASGNVYCFQNCGDIDSPTIASATGGNGSTGGAVYCFQNCGDIDSPTITAATGGNSTSGGGGKVGGAVYCFQNCDYIDSPTITAATGGNGSTSGGAVYCFQNCDYIDSPTITSATGGYGTSGGAVYCFQNCGDITSPTIASATGGNGSPSTGYGVGGAVYCFQNCDYIDSPTITAATGGNGSTSGGAYGIGGAVYCFQNCGDIDSPTITAATGGNSTKTIGTTYGYYGCWNVDHPKGILAASVGPSYLHYLWSGLIENRAGSNAKTALFYPDYGPYALALSAEPVRGQSVTMQWRFISPDGTTVAGKTARLQVTLDGGAAWTDIYTGTAETYTYSVPASAESVRFRVFEGTAESPTSGAAYSEVTEFTDTAVISGTDTNLGTFDTTFTPYQFSISKAADDPDTWTAANIKIYLDNAVIDTYTLARNTQKTIAFTGSVWKKIRNGAHTLKIEARRIIGGSPSGSMSYRTLTFTRAMTTAQFSLMESAVSATKPGQMTLSLGGAFPSGCVVTAEACNNANDPTPAWEAMTASTSTTALKLMALTFANASKVAADWGVNIRVRLERGTAGAAQNCYIDSCVGDYE
jgi:hypothetical protein